jgi:hypothetical protein
MLAACTLREREREKLSTSGRNNQSEAEEFFAATRSGLRNSFWLAEFHTCYNVLQLVRRLFLNEEKDIN